MFSYCSDQKSEAIKAVFFLRGVIGQVLSNTRRFLVDYNGSLSWCRGNSWENSRSVRLFSSHYSAVGGADTVFVRLSRRSVSSSVFSSDQVDSGRILISALSVG